MSGCTLFTSTAYSFQTWLPALGHMRLAGFLPYFLIGLWSANSGSCKLPSLPGLMGSDKSGGLESLGTPSEASVLAPSIFFFKSLFLLDRSYSCILFLLKHRPIETGEKRANGIGWANYGKVVERVTKGVDQSDCLPFFVTILKTSRFSLEHQGWGQLVSSWCVGSCTCSSLAEFLSTSFMKLAFYFHPLSPSFHECCSVEDLFYLVIQCFPMIFWSD